MGQKEVKRNLRTVALVPLMSLIAVTLTGCYEVVVKTRVCEDVDAAPVRTTVFHGVSTEIYNSADDALTAVKARYDQSNWITEETQFHPGNTTDYWVPKLYAQKDRSEPALFSDSDNNRLTAEWVSFDESATGYPYWELNLMADTTSPVRPELASNFEWEVEFPVTWDYQLSPERFMSATTSRTFSQCEENTTLLRLTFTQQGEISPTIRLLPPWAPPESPAQDPEPLNEPQSDPVESQPVSPPEDDANPPADEPSELEKSAGAEQSATVAPTDEAKSEDQDNPLLEAAPLSDLEGKIGVATTEISESVGLVEVDSQLLPAVAVGNTVIAAGTEVEIVGTFSQGVLVKQTDAEFSDGFVWMWIGALALAAGVGIGLFLIIRRPKSRAGTT